jgi:hypothetical protein
MEPFKEHLLENFGERRTGQFGPRTRGPSIVYHGADLRCRP